MTQPWNYVYDFVEKIRCYIIRRLNRNVHITRPTVKKNINNNQ